MCTELSRMSGLVLDEVAPTTPDARMGATTPGLGKKTDVVYEWWNVALIKEFYKKLRAEEAEAVRQVKREAVPWKHPRTGAIRNRPTAAEKLVQKKRERGQRPGGVLERVPPPRDDPVQMCGEPHRMSPSHQDLHRHNFRL